MEQAQVLQYLQENPHVVTTVLTTQHVEQFLATEDGKRWLQPKLDSHFSKGLETWKANNLEGLVEKEVSQRYPAETPEQKRIRELEQKLERTTQEILRKELTVKAQGMASEMGLPSELAHFFVGESEDTTREAIEKFHGVYKTQIDAQVVERTKGSTPTTPVGEGAKKGNSFSDFAKSYQG